MKAIWFESGATRVAYSDASATGYGGFIVRIGQSMSHGQWSSEERDELNLEGGIRCFDGIY